MTTAPAADQHRLLEVQDLDTRLDQNTHRRRTLPVLERIAELSAQLADLDAALVSSRTAAGDLRRELTKAETDVEQVRSRAARDQARLEAGAGAKDAQALTSEIESLARRQADLEEVELGVMERLEAHTAALAELERAQVALVEQQAQAAVEREQAERELDEEAERLRAQRTAAAEGLDAGLLALYERLRTQLAGRGAAALRGRQCDGCRMELNPLDLERIRSAAEDQVVRCEECGRILVR